MHWVDLSSFDAVLAGERKNRGKGNKKNPGMMPRKTSRKEHRNISVKTEE